MAKTASRRLDLRMPPDHPVFEIPDGERARQAREWMEMGRSLTLLDERLNRIEQALQRLESGRASGFDLRRDGRRVPEKNGLNIKRLEADILSVLG